MDSSKEWDSWEDCLGNKYQAGDVIAVATISGRSPQLVLAVVERINKVNSSGEEIFTNKSFTLDEPIRHEMECSVLKMAKNANSYYDRYYVERAQNHQCVPSCTERWQKEEVRKVPSCTVKARPILNARGFTRWSINQDGLAKAVTYSIPENIILVEKRS